MATLRRPVPPVIAAALAVVLVVLGAGLWALTRYGSGDSDPEQEAPVREPSRVMIAGDSMTQGANGDWTWRYRLWNHLAPHVEGLDFVGPYTAPATRDMMFPVPTAEDAATDAPEEPTTPSATAWPGADGDPATVEYRDPSFDQDHNALWGRTLLDATGSIEEEVRAHQPDVLCVMIGVNDLLWPVETEEMEQRLRDYVEAARRGNPNLRVVIGEALPIALAETDEGFALRVYAYNEVVRAVAADLTTDASPVVGVDIAGPLGWNPAVDAYDGTHPNADGELKIAAAFADTLSRRFGMGPAYPRPLPLAT
ncbi:GDSL family lipase [Nocardiopsis sp. CNR-923]|uniref:GDSL-type esterase/lipase family protein n=1 Tax=Nocardiopsis sp. CNR-923 TaxID=1904965 RepID=UPI0009693D15|nr:GDSL-type esterase/lipase family protein [Nocardiopsis sp. CNR-923]OLT26797.1 GDSL family lipase [Nocardiopsis sp. CNR-923]